MGTAYTSETLVKKKKIPNLGDSSNIPKDSDFIFITLKKGGTFQKVSTLC